MSWHPHPIAVALAVIMLIVAVWFGVQGRHTRGRTATTILDVLLAVLVGLISLHPVVGESGRQSSSVDADIVIMVDTTTSMAARDNGGKTRLSGAIHDIAALASVFSGARFTLVTFDNDARVLVASTTDTGTIISAANSLTWREDTKAPAPISVWPCPPPSGFCRRLANPRPKPPGWCSTSATGSRRLPGRPALSPLSNL
ncbi:von Willebrand factor, type A [Cutibacterium acnes JCM 18909]|nr:von Willebrand factor, type A [Cutibacterium acnes JCM 18909]